LRKIENYTDEEIESLVIHELCHFLVAPMQSNKNNSEITVTMIARILKGLNDSR
jgi:predicted SprT family Zn-dependent metalloprotease